MDHKASKLTIMYHKFFVYLPPLLIIFLISMIYVSYWINYLAPLLLNYNTEKENINSLLKYPFELSSSPYKSFTKGLVLAIFTSFFLILLLICLFRTIFSDPGNFPNPMDLEFQIVMKNLMHEQHSKNSTASFKLNKNGEYDIDKYKRNESEEIIEKEIFKFNRNPNRISDDNITNNYSNNNKDNNSMKNNDNNNDNNLSNIYYTENSIENLKDDPHNIVHFRNNIEIAPICYEEYTKRTLFLENWDYKSLKIKEYEDFEKEEKNDFNVNNKNGKDSFKLKNGKTSKIDKSKNIKNNQSLNINNKKSYFSLDSTTQNVSNLNPLELELKPDNAENYYANNQKILRKKQNQNSGLINNIFDISPQFDGYVGYDVGRAFLCGTCVRIKIERSHHCKQCGKCILKMDHHCPWLANCIGYANYKFFLLSHFYGIITSLFVLCSYWETIFNNLFDFESSVIQLSWNMFVYVNAIGLMSFLTWLFWVNWMLMFQGLTVIENADRERFPNAKFANQYDLGYYKNFVSVFGESPWVWFLPIMSDDKYKGVYFEKKNKKEEKLMSYI